MDWPISSHWPIAAWLAVAATLLLLDPVGNTVSCCAAALGAAVALTLAPLLWLGGFVMRGRGIAYRGDWWRAARRALLVGLVVTLLVVLQGERLLTPPLALFIVGMAVLIELSLWLRRSAGPSAYSSAHVSRAKMRGGRPAGPPNGTGGSPRVRSVVQGEHAFPDFARIAPAGIAITAPTSRRQCQRTWGRYFSANDRGSKMRQR